MRLAVGTSESFTPQCNPWQTLSSSQTCLLVVRQPNVQLSSSSHTCNSITFGWLNWHSTGLRGSPPVIWQQLRQFTTSSEKWRPAYLKGWDIITSWVIGMRLGGMGMRVGDMGVRLGGMGVRLSGSEVYGMTVQLILLWQDLWWVLRWPALLLCIPIWSCATGTERQSTERQGTAKWRKDWHCDKHLAS